MNDELVFRHRQRLKHHFVNTSKVLLYGYSDLSDAAKITFQVIDGFDWEDKTTGEAKGYAFPASETIAEIRGTTVRTVQRHIRELEDAGLLTRARRKHRASVLYIEDVSQVEIERYMALFVDKGRAKTATAVVVDSTGNDRMESDTSMTSTADAHSAPPIRNDKSVASAEPAKTTGLSFDYRGEKEVKKNNVNVVKSPSKGLQSMQAILRGYTITAPPKPGRAQRSEAKAKRDYLAQSLADEFHDADGLGCYRRIADKLPADVIYQLLAEVRETARQGRVRTSSAAIFVSAAKQYAREHNIALGFEKRGRGNATSRPPAAGP